MSTEEPLPQTLLEKLAVLEEKANYYFYEMDQNHCVGPEECARNRAAQAVVAGYADEIRAALEAPPRKLFNYAEKGNYGGEAWVLATTREEADRILRASQSDLLFDGEQHAAHNARWRAYHAKHVEKLISGDVEELEVGDIGWTERS